MTTLYHKCTPNSERCTAQVVAQMPLMIQVVTFGTSSGREFFPLVTTMNSSPTSQPVTWKCTVCEKIFTEKELNDEVFLDCSYCGELHLLRDSICSSYTPPLGKKCFEALITKEKISPTARRYDLVSSLMSINLSK